MDRSQEECIRALESIRWGGVPQCPYCESRRSTPIERNTRYHCNECYTSYSVTVGTIFHKTHLPLYKWIQAIKLVYQQEPQISVRRLAREIGVNKNTANYMLRRIELAKAKDSDILRRISEL